MLNIYHAKFYLKIRTGSLIILTVFLDFGRPPLLNSKNDRAYHKRVGTSQADRK